MRITDLLSASSIDLNAKPLNKKEAIEQAVKLMAASGNITDIEAYTYRTGTGITYNTW